MRVPRLRISVKRLMIAIAALAIVLGFSIEGIRLKRRRDAFLQKAAEHGLSKEISRVDQESALAMAETADEDRLRLEKIQQDYPTRDPAIARMSRSGNADLDRLWMEIEADRRLAKSLEKLPPESWNADLKRRMMEADRRWAGWLEKSLDGRRVEAAEQRAKAARLAETVAYHAMLERRYLRAASRPWLSVEPEPPPPHEQFLTGIYWAERGQHAAAPLRTSRPSSRNPTASWPSIASRGCWRPVRKTESAMGSGPSNWRIEPANCLPGRLPPASKRLPRPTPRPATSRPPAIASARRSVCFRPTTCEWSPIAADWRCYVSHKPYREVTNH